MSTDDGGPPTADRRPPMTAAALDAAPPPSAACGPSTTVSGRGAGPPLVVRLDQFEGPLDLLLMLIERRELEITAVSVAAVADQYLDQVRRLAPLPADELAAFLVIAGKLLLIKSRALLPRPPAPAEAAEEDPAEELARRLREYRQFKAAARALAELDTGDRRTYPRLAPPPAPAPPPLAPMSARQLLRALERLLAAELRRRPADEVEGVPAPQPTIPERIALIEARLRADRTVRFGRLLSAATTRREVVVTFLALLELLKQGRVAVRQAELFGEIVLEAAGGDLPAPQTAI